MRLKKLLLPVLAVGLALSLLFAAGCQLTTKIETAASETTAAPTVTGVTPVSVIVTSATPLPSIADVVAAVKPSVVAISVKVPYYDFFGRYVGEQEGAGTGWIYSADGLIVTNAHVIEGATSIMVTFNDGSSLPADVKNVKSDTLTDLAVLKVEAANLTVLPTGDADKLREGEWVVAIGNSLGEGIRVTQGIISRLEVSMQDEYGNTLEGLLETDTVINPGNSGGPLVNLAGAIVGITNAKRVQTGVEGVGYAININEAMPIIQQLISNGYVVRPYFGISGETVSGANYARWYDLGTTSGVRITAVGAGSPAEAAGIKVNDVVVKFNGEDITEGTQLVKAIHRASIGQTVAVEIYRGTEKLTVNVTMSESPKPE